MGLRGRRETEIAIVGAGAAGLYAAKRLSDARPGCRIRIYDAHDRLGGRLWSAASAGAVAELGAMSISDRHENVSGLVAALGMERVGIEFRDRLHFVRGVELGLADYADSDRTPYRLAPQERGKTPRALLVEAIGALLPRIGAMWPFAEAPPQATAEYLRNAAPGGIPLWRWGFWNLLATVRSHEAIELMAATFGSTAAFRNANALDAIFTLIWEAQPGQQHYRLTLGMSAFAMALATACGPRVDVALNYKLAAATHTGAKFELLFTTPEGPRTEYADTIIAALPKRALDGVAFDASLTGPRFRQDSACVSPVPACKLYLQFDKAWWRSAPAAAGREEIGACFTDLPMRQCYYFTPRDGEAALLLACFADDIASSFWSVMGEARGEGGPPSAAFAPPRVIESAMAQLRALHPATHIDAPVGAHFVDWSAEPFGGAWHAWRAGVRSWEVRARMRQPNPNLPFFTCGEAFAQPQGWIEGALNNAEMMLERHFGAARPDWVGDEYPFEI